MNANFTSVVLENGLLPIAGAVRKRLGLSPGDQVRISIKVLNQPARRATRACYAHLLEEKDVRVLTPQEQAELIALANAEFDAAIASAKKFLQKKNPDLFDKRGNLNRQKAMALLHHSKRKKNASGNGRLKKG